MRGVKRPGKGRGRVWGQGKRPGDRLGGKAGARPREGREEGSGKRPWGGAGGGVGAGRGRRERP